MLGNLVNWIYLENALLSDLQSSFFFELPNRSEYGQLKVRCGIIADFPMIRNSAQTSSYSISIVVGW